MTVDAPKLSPAMYPRAAGCPPAWPGRAAVANGGDWHDASCAVCRRATRWNLVRGLLSRDRWMCQGCGARREV
jgi:hypothetical protein